MRKLLTFLIALGAICLPSIGALAQFISLGGTPPYTFFETGSLPTGLTINTSTGVISGTSRRALSDCAKNNGSSHVQAHGDDWRQCKCDRGGNHKAIVGRSFFFLGLSA
jgi:Putative Ig domain